MCNIHLTKKNQKIIILLDKLKMVGTGMIDITKEPISSFIANNYRTVEIIAYMKSLCDE